MKKFVSLMLALAMAFSLSVSAMAEETVTVKTADLTDSTEEASQTVKITFVDGENFSTIYKVDIVWGNLTFTYTDADESVWDPENHVMTEVGEGTWSAASSVIVNNHSNAAVKAKAVFSNDSKTITEGNTTLTISTTGASEGFTPDAQGFVTLLDASTDAAGVENKDGIEGATKIVYTITPSGSASESNENFDTITVTINKAS